MPIGIIDKINITETNGVLAGANKSKCSTCYRIFFYHICINFTNKIAITPPITNAIATPKGPDPLIQSPGNTKHAKPIILPKTIAKKIRWF